MVLSSQMDPRDAQIALMTAEIARLQQQQPAHQGTQPTPYPSTPSSQPGVTHLTSLHHQTPLVAPAPAPAPPAPSGPTYQYPSGASMSHPYPAAPAIQAIAPPPSWSTQPTAAPSGVSGPHYSYDGLANPSTAGGMSVPGFAALQAHISLANHGRMTSASQEAARHPRRRGQAHATSSLANLSNASSAASSSGAPVMVRIRVRVIPAMVSYLLSMH